MSIENARFSFYAYHDKIIDLLTRGFPILADESVLFMSAEDGQARRFNDLALPAFVMCFSKIEPLATGVPMRDMEMGGRLERTTGGTVLDISDLQFYLNIKIHLSGSLVLPKFPEDANDGKDPNPDNLNPLLALHQAAVNIAALIFAAARGWNCEAAKIENIEYVPDDDSEIMLIEWSHQAIVGRPDDDAVVNILTAYRQWEFMIIFKIPSPKDPNRMKYSTATGDAFLDATHTEFRIFEKINKGNRDTYITVNKAAHQKYHIDREYQTDFAELGVDDVLQIDMGDYRILSEYAHIRDGAGETDKNAYGWHVKHEDKSETPDFINDKPYVWRGEKEKSLQIKEQIDV